jgi:hypothetical protein
MASAGYVRVPVIKPVGKLDMGVVESVGVAVGPADNGAVMVGPTTANAVRVAFTEELMSLVAVVEPAG